MNVNDGFFRNWMVKSKKNQRGKTLNLLTVQEGLSSEQKRTKRHGNVFDSTSSASSDLAWKNNNNNTKTSLNGSASTRSNYSSADGKITFDVLAITEGRGEASCEVGIACLNIAESSLVLSQISDTSSYVNVLTKINIMGPNEIVIPLTMVQSRLTAKLKQQFQGLKITAITRQCFNKANGIEYVKKVCAPAWNSIFLILQHKYYALAATSALFAYIESKLYKYFASESMKVEYQESEGYAIIDVFTADKLELVACALPSSDSKYSSLRGILNHCVTKIGSRILRATLLQPPCSLQDIEERLDCVEELIRNPDKIYAIQEHLKKLTNVDQLLTLGTILPDQANNCSGRQLNYIMLLNSLLRLLEPLLEVLENLPQQFFVEVRECLGCEELAKLKTMVSELIHCEASPRSGERGTMERCFAVKAGVNEFLDILRENYTKRLNSMNEYVQELAREHNLNLKLVENTKKGYHIVLPLDKREMRASKMPILPKEFIQVQRLNTQMTMKTMQILMHTARLDDVTVEILKLSNVIIYYLLLETQKNLPIFYKVCELVAKLDLIQSLAKASCDLKYVRPKFLDFLEIHDGRHPLLDYLSDIEPVPNYTFASPYHNMHIVTGPNGSGKSIFIRQIVLLQVMAQIGCFVPASSATFRIADRIFARIYLEDNMDCGASAFTLEMKEIKYFLTAMTKSSLIVVDELCRSTSIKDGTALAAAICEKFITQPAFIFFTTHYTDITRLSQLYYGVQCWQMEATVVEGPNRRHLKCTHRVLPGVTCLKEYAIYLAKCSWHEDTIEDVELILEQLQKPKDLQMRYAIEPPARLKYDLESELKIMKSKSELTVSALHDKLTAYQIDLEKFGITMRLDEIRAPGGNEMKAVDNDMQDDDDDDDDHVNVEEYENEMEINEKYVLEFESSKSFVTAEVEAESPHPDNNNACDLKKPKSPDLLSVNELQFAVNLLRGENFRTSTPISSVRNIDNGESEKVDDVLLEVVQNEQSRGWENIEGRSFDCTKLVNDFIENPKHILSDISRIICELSMDSRQCTEMNEIEKDSDRKEDIDDSIFLQNTVPIDCEQSWQKEERRIWSLNINAEFEANDNVNDSINLNDEWIANNSKNGGKCNSTLPKLDAFSVDLGNAELRNIDGGNVIYESPSSSLIAGGGKRFKLNLETDGSNQMMMKPLSNIFEEPAAFADFSYQDEDGRISVEKHEKVKPARPSSLNEELSTRNTDCEDVGGGAEFSSFDDYQSSLRKKAVHELSVKEINSLYRAKDMELKESGDVEAYGNEIANRPNAKQIRAIESIATAFRTANGSVAIPSTSKRKPKRPNKSRFQTPLKFGASFDVSVFSDKNSTIFHELMRSDKSGRGDDFDYMKFKATFDKNATTSSCPHRSSDGKTDFYKRNEDEMNRIMQKYLQDK
ncbi:PREDICTED: mutS protein homolog 4-like [Nicrophorus vespilloides]|uniref:MutS protein homolog 4-like n=1 Tax=Nicrophorus vespilloides TaxID=110193 RepID=A0ABM1M8R1_NICVS|nr:PREDICTED: mutS protein homolog 4-like [Nicrophorus vespilloides]